MSTPRQSHVHDFPRRKGEWRWTAFDANGKRVAVTGKGYINEQHAEQMAAERNQNDKMSSISRAGLHSSNRYMQTAAYGPPIAVSTGRPGPWDRRLSRCAIRAPNHCAKIPRRRGRGTPRE